ncbi:MAG: hypothetical protein R8F63_07160 [Acidimicrobiales bacterium]|nr:hypothetical protein [Acidimicrobiales bacterium]
MNQPAPRRKRSRSRKRGGNASNSGGAKNTNRNQAKKAQPKVDPVEFWGDSDALPERIDGLRHSPDVRAVLTSLGRPPLTGNETAAEHWFSMVYERAAFLAGALAAAGDLDADDEPAD